MELLFLLLFMLLTLVSTILAVVLLSKLNQEERKLDWIYAISEMSQSHPGSEFQALTEISSYIEENGNSDN